MTDRSRIERFAAALVLALHDRQLELSGINIVHYYDADVVLPMVMGFEHIWAGDRPGPNADLVRSLLSCGFLGEVHMLRPHAWELLDRLRSKAPPLTTAEQKDYQKRAHQFFASTGIERVMNELRSISRQKTRSQEERQKKVDSFLEVLRNTAGDTFASIERTNGTWVQRYRRYIDRKILNLNELGPEMDDLLSTDAEALSSIEKALITASPNKNRFSVFQDAAALTSLHRQVAGWSIHNANPQVRFYTETQRLRDACIEPSSLRTLLSYPTDSLGSDSVLFDPHLVIRDSGYYIMRAWFKELRAGGHTDLGRFEKLSVELRELLSKQDKGDILLQRISEITLQGSAAATDPHDTADKPLSSLIDEFENLTITKSIWTKDRVPRPEFLSEKRLKEWTTVFAFAKGEETGSRLFEQILQLESALQTRVARIFSWNEGFSTILKAAHYKRKRVTGTLQRPMRDLGLARWGYDLTPQEEGELLRLLAPLFHGNDDELGVAAGNLATCLERAARNERTCMIACAVLWALGLFAEIVDLVRAYRDQSQSIGPSLTIIEATARAKKGVPTHRERAELVQSVRTLKASLSQPDLERVLLGIGYVLYHCWRQEKIRCSMSGGDSDSPSADIMEWAAESMRVGEEAARSPDENLDLRAAFAANHCAYVGIVTELQPETTERFVTVLIRLQGFAELWNNRFDDTLGMYYLKRIEDDWRRTGGLEMDAEITERIRLAGHYFSLAARDNFDDIDLEEHNGRLQRIKDMYLHPRAGKTPR